ncbi:ribonuclease H-like domain-containing protein [Tanacetum coccineum]
MSGSQDEIPPPPPSSSSQTPTQQTPHIVSTIKLPIHKKGEYDIWATKMEHYLAHTDYPIWEVIQNRNGHVSITTDTQGQIKVLPPRTAEEILARERERKARTTLLMALPEDHLAKFHKMTDAKEMWDAIKSRFGGNDESKKMQKYILKQQFEGVSVSNSEGLHKGSLPSAWSQVSLIMRTKPGVDSLSFDDLYNNLRVFENDIKGSTASSSSTQNVAFVSENTSSTNDVSTAYSVSNTSGHNSQYEQTSSYSLLANQSSCPQLDHEDLEQLDEFDLEEMDLKWQVAMISMRMKKFYKKTGRKLQFDAKEPVGFDKTKVECYNCHKTGHFARECRTKGNQDSRRRDAWNSGNKDGRRSGKQEDSKALVTIDGEGVDWTSHSEEEEDYALMACNSSGSDTEDLVIARRDMHFVPPPMTGNYMPSGPDIEIDYSQFTYGPKQSQPSESETQTSDFDTCESDCSVETHESLPEPTVNEPKVVSQPKVWSDAPIIEEYESDSEDEHVSLPTEEQETPSFANQDCDFHEKMMAKQVELNKKKGKDNVQRENKPVWNNVQRVNHKNQFVPRPVQQSGKIPVNTAKVNVVSAVRGNKETAVKPSAGYNWRPKRNYWHKISKYNGGSRLRDCATFKDLLGRLKPKKAWAYLAEYQDFNGGPVSFGGSKGYITGKGLSLYCQYGPCLSSQQEHKANNAGEEPTKHPDFQQVDKEDQVFLDELKRLKRQEQDANDSA